MSDFNPRNYPICERCGHEPSMHTTTRCAHGPTAIFRDMPPCDCPGWKLDINWKSATPPLPLFAASDALKARR